MSTPMPLPSAPASPIPGLNTFLIGPTGTGKTDALVSLVAAGLELFVIFTEPHGRSVLLSAAKRRGVDESKIHWVYVPPQSGTWDDFMQRAKRMTAASWAMLAGSTEDPQKGKFTGFYNLLASLHDFQCERCGKKYGDVSTWGTDRAIALDSLSGINEVTMQMVAGESIAKSQPQWGAAMNAELLLINKLCYSTRAFFVLTAHIERQVNEITGGTYLVPMALGRKLAPDLPRYFNDVILTVRDGEKFLWSTATPNADLKATTLKIGDKIEPSFVPLVNEWQARGGIIESQPQGEPKA